MYKNLLEATGTVKGRQRHGMAWRHQKREPHKLTLEGRQCHLGPDYHDGREPPRPLLTLNFTKGVEHLRQPKVHSLRVPCHDQEDFKEQCIDAIEVFLPSEEVETLEELYEEGLQNIKAMPDVSQSYLDTEVFKI